MIPVLTPEEVKQRHEARFEYEAECATEHALRAFNKNPKLDCRLPLFWPDAQKYPSLDSCAIARTRVSEALNAAGWQVKVRLVLGWWRGPHLRVLDNRPRNWADGSLYDDDHDYR
jgi:hypothetical protein